MKDTSCSMSKNAGNIRPNTDANGKILADKNSHKQWYLLKFKSIARFRVPEVYFEFKINSAKFEDYFDSMNLESSLNLNIVIKNNLIMMQSLYIKF